jgi:Arc/MetJ-type ribon-helix-helix transcriptional regulator
MNVKLGSEAEAKIAERLNTGRCSSPAEVVNAGLELLEARDSA